MTFRQHFSAGSSKYVFNGATINGGSIVFGESLPCLEPVNISDMSVTVNGHAIQGKYISMINGVLYVDEKVHAGAADAATTNDGKWRALEIVIQGNVADKIDTTSGAVTVYGNTKNIGTMSGAVHVHDGNVDGNVSTMSGAVTCAGEIGGSVSTMSGGILSSSSTKKTENRRRIGGA